MKKTMVLVLVSACITIGLQAQIKVGSDLTAFTSYSLAAPEQMVGGTEPGTYFDKKNGNYLNGNMYLQATDPVLWDALVKINFRTRSGSPYLPLSTVYAASSDSSITLDSAWLNLSLAGALRFNELFDLRLKGGKFQTTAQDLSVSGFHLENVQSMVKTANSSSVGLNAGIKLADPAGPGLAPSTLSLEFLTSSLIEEALPGLYDTDGTMSMHGLPILNEYVPQLFGDIKLSALQLSFGTLSAELDYAYNGANINSGHSVGLGSKLTIRLSEPAATDEAATGPILLLPISLNGAFYEKNIDALAGLTGTLMNADSTDFRNTLRVGLGVGFVYQEAGVFEGKLNLSGTYNRIAHIYRDPLDVVSLALDGQIRISDSFVVGAGAVLASLNEPIWMTAAGVATTKDNYRHQFALLQNLGYEAFIGLDLTSTIQISAGYYSYAGMALAYGLKRAKDGVVKSLQVGTAQADGLYEAHGIFVALNFKL